LKQVRQYTKEITGDAAGMKLQKANQAVKAPALEAEAGNLAKAAEALAPAVATLEDNEEERKIKFPCGMGNRENGGCLILPNPAPSPGEEKMARFSQSDWFTLCYRIMPDPLVPGGTRPVEYDNYRTSQDCIHAMHGAYNNKLRSS
jgi:hypothetical protein